MDHEELEDERGRMEFVAVMLATGLCALLIPAAMLVIDTVAAWIGGPL